MSHNFCYVIFQIPGPTDKINTPKLSAYHVGFAKIFYSDSAPFVLSGDTSVDEARSQLKVFSIIMCNNERLGIRTTKIANINTFWSDGLQKRYFESQKKCGPESTERI